MHTVNYLRGRRVWYIREYSVWGTADEAALSYIGVESVDSTGRIMFGLSAIGGSVQNVNFSELIDFKGNAIPSNINSPRVIIRPRSPFHIHIVGEESNAGFRIARDPSAPGPLTADIFIMELG
jgi:hypothetical protein